MLICCICVMKSELDYTELYRITRVETFNLFYEIATV